MEIQSALVKLHLSKVVVLLLILEHVLGLWFSIMVHNFIKTMLKLASSREELSIIHDQIGAPTGAALIADVTAQALKYYSLMDDLKQQKDLLGHYHLAAAGQCSMVRLCTICF